MRIFLLLSTLLSCSSFAQINPAFNQYLSEALERRIQMSPLQMSWWGFDVKFDKAEPFTYQYAQKEASFLQQELQTLEKHFPYKSLSEQEKVQYDVLAYKYREEIERKQKYFYHDDVFNPWTGGYEYYTSHLMYVELKEETDVELFLLKLKNSNSHFEDLVMKSKQAEKQGITESSTTLKDAIDGIKSYMSGYPIDGDPKIENPIFKNFKTQIKNMNLSTTVEKEYFKRVKDLLRNEWKRSLTKLLTRAENLASRVKKDFGVTSLPSGEAFYQFLLRSHTTTNLTAEDIHNKGLKEVKRIKREMLEIKKKVGFQGSLKEFFEYLRTDPKFFYENSESGRKNYLAETKSVIEEMTTLASKYFLNPPTAPVNIEMVDPSTPYRSVAYYHPELNGGTYFLDLRDMSQLPRHELQVLAYHEASPGHHFHMSYVRQIKDLPKFRLYTFFNAHGEGWGLYVEKFTHEIGLYKDIFADMGRLNFEMLRAIRLVVDTGIHKFGWSLEEAVQFGLENSGMTPMVLEAQMKRYLAYPGQATSYKVGMDFFLEKRDEAKAKLGSSFDIKKYHEIVLANGFLPLEIISKHIDKWVTSTKRQAK